MSESPELAIGDYVMKIMGYGAGKLTGIVIGIEKEKVVVFTENEIDSWHLRFVRVMYEI